MRPFVCLAALLATLAFVAQARAAGSAWRAPTPGSVTRGFAMGADAFAAGNHRGADFAAAPGTPVRAACSGRVVVAARIGSSGGVVTIACGPWRVSHLPLATIGPPAGARVKAGDPIGTAAPSRVHAGVHLGVRRAGRPFGYVNPLRFIGDTRHVPMTGPPAGGRERRRPAPPRVAPPPVVAPRESPAVAGPLAPWPAWAGLAAVLLAAAGTGARRRRGSRAARTRSSGAARAPVRLARDDLGP
jgi:hypothetical protein